MIRSDTILRIGTQLRFRLDSNGMKNAGDIVTIKDIAIDVDSGDIFLDFEEETDLLFTWGKLFEIYKQPWDND